MVSKDLPDDALPGVWKIKAVKTATWNNHQK